MVQNVKGRWVSRRKVTDAIRSLVNAMSLELQCARVLYKALLLPVLLYGRKTKKGKTGHDDLVY